MARTGNGWKRYFPPFRWTTGGSKDPYRDTMSGPAVLLSSSGLTTKERPSFKTREPGKWKREETGEEGCSLSLSPELHLSTKDRDSSDRTPTFVLRTVSFWVFTRAIILGPRKISSIHTTNPKVRAYTLHGGSLKQCYNRVRGKLHFFLFILLLP